MAPCPTPIFSGQTNPNLYPPFSRLLKELSPCRETRGALIRSCKDGWFKDFFSAVPRQGVQCINLAGVKNGFGRGCRHDSAQDHCLIFLSAFFYLSVYLFVFPTEGRKYISSNGRHSLLPKECICKWISKFCKPIYAYYFLFIIWRSVAENVH